MWVFISFLSEAKSLETPGLAPATIVKEGSKRKEERKKGERGRKCGVRGEGGKEDKIGRKDEFKRTI